MFKTLKGLLLNGLTHYNLKNRIEYLKLLLRIKLPKNYQIETNNYFNAKCIRVISLPSKLDRRKFMRAQMTSQHINFSFIDAFEGSELNNKPPESIISDRSVCYLSTGSIGCWISHYKVWEIIANLSECSVIVEDDVRLCDCFIEKLNTVIKFIPADADIIYLNSGNNYLRNMRYKVNEVAFVPYQIRNGAYAYFVTEKGIRKLLQLVPSVKVTRGGVDSAIGALIRNKKINAYHLIEPLCEVDLSFGSSTKKQA